MSKSGQSQQKPESNDDRAEQEMHFLMRPIEMSDAEQIADWYLQIEDVSIFDRLIPVPINRPEVVAQIEGIVSDQSKSKCHWFVAETPDGNLAGASALEAINPLHGHALLPVFIAHQWRRSGLGIRIAAMMLDMAFRQLRLHRVATVYRADNAATAAMIRRLGFVDEGVLRQAWFANGIYHDVMNVSVLVEDWEQTRVELCQQLSSSVSVRLGPRASNEWTWPNPEMAG